jgi:hypothetical protein
MGSTTIPAASSGKTRYLTTLTSGTSYTVPSGVTYLNVTCRGGGGGGGSGGGSSAQPVLGSYGFPGQVKSDIIVVSPGEVVTIGIGAGASAASAGSNGNSGGGTSIYSSLSSLSVSGGNGGRIPSQGGNFATAYMGAGNGGAPGGYYSGGSLPGGPGGSGSIDIEYWV